MDINPQATPSVQQLNAARQDINQLIEKMRSMSSAAQSPVESKQVPEANAFSDLLTQAKTAVDKVNDLQSTSKELKTAYVSGKENVSLAQVVLASQESGLAFQAMLSVRNKLLEAYKEVMNMPI